MSGAKNQDRMLSCSQEDLLIKSIHKNLIQLMFKAKLEVNKGQQKRGWS